MIIEPATAADARAIGIVHVLAWHETYRGMMPDQVLASLNPSERETMWASVIAGSGGVYVLRDGTRVTGFGAAGRNRDASLPHAGMINTMYLLGEAQRRGHGRQMMGVLARHLLATGMPDAALWVANDNTGARQFYEKLGGAVVGHATELHEGWDMACTAYGWDDLTVLTHSLT